MRQSHAVDLRCRFSMTCESEGSLWTPACSNKPEFFFIAARTSRSFNVAPETVKDKSYLI